MLKYLAIVAAVLIAHASFAAAVTAPFLTPAGAGGTSSVSGTLVAIGQHYDMANIIKGMVTPYVFTNEEVGATTGQQLLLIKLPDGGAMYNVIWNFTVAESDTIRTWVAAQSKRNNLVVSFTATWNAQNRFAIDTASWVFAEPSLFPYGAGPTCNATAALMCLGALQAAIPFDCVNTGIPALKKCVVDHQACLVHIAKGLGLVNSFCTLNRQAVDTLFCSDGRVGGDAVCDYVKCTMPNGKPAATDVVTVGANGLPSSGNACSGSNSAGSVLVGAAVAVLAIVAALL